MDGRTDNVKTVYPPQTKFSGGGGGGGYNKYVSANGSKNFRKGRHTHFFNYFLFWKNDIILCISKYI